MFCVLRAGPPHWDCSTGAEAERTVNIGVIDFRTTMAVCIVLVGVGLGVAVSLAGSDYV